MFLSVIVSCHNCKEYIERVLNSIVIQNFKDCEIILSDDNSTDNFMELVTPYTNLLDIKYYKVGNHKYHCPGNTRIDGWKHASGDWITFMDHDDEFISGAFKLLYNTVMTSPDKNNFFFSPVQQVKESGEPVRQLDAITWLHGNFYNRKWLLENNINFKEDLRGNEDLYFNNLVHGHITGQNAKFWSSSKPLYKWYVNSKSLSNSQPEGTDCGYTEKYFNDYVTANVETSENLIKLYPDKLPYFKEMIARNIVNVYFYYERALYLFKDKEIINNMLLSCKYIYNSYINVFKGKEEEIISYAYKNADDFVAWRELVFSLSGKFIENHSFKEFLNIINNG